MNTLDELYAVILEGKRAQARELVQRALDEGVAPLSIV